VFITFEGPEGSGKTTQAQLLARHLHQQGYNTLLTREPGGTSIGDQIREVLHDPANLEMFPTAEILLYSASRAQLVAQVIRPALEEGQLVICDRYADSTMAYQGYGRGLDIQALYQITRLATGDLVPDLTLYLDIQPEKGLERRLSSGDEWNRLDQERIEFHRRVRAGYKELIALEPQRWVTIDAARMVEEVQQEIQAVVGERLAVAAS
jgi:dTMP kinase